MTNQQKAQKAHAKRVALLASAQSGEISYRESLTQCREIGRVAMENGYHAELYRLARAHSNATIEKFKADYPR